MSIIKLRKKMGRGAKTGLIIISAIFFGSIFYGYGSYMWGQRANIGVNIVAKVDRTKISREAFDEEYKRALQQSGDYYNRIKGISLEGIKASVLEQKIDRIILLKEAKKERIKISRKEINKKYDGIKESFPSKQIFLDTLTQMRFTEAEFKDAIKNDSTIQKLQKEKKDKFYTWFKTVKAEHKIEIYDYQIVAHNFMMERKWDEAIKNYQKALKYDPENPYIYYGIGRAYEEKNNLDEALDYYSKALSYGEGDGDLHFALGNVYKKKKQIDKALYEYKQAGELALGDILLQLSLSSVYKELGKEKESQKAKKQADIMIKAYSQRGNR